MPTCILDGYAYFRLDEMLDDYALLSTGLIFQTVDMSGPKPIFVYWMKENDMDSPHTTNVVLWDDDLEKAFADICQADKLTPP